MCEVEELQVEQSVGPAIKERNGRRVNKPLQMAELDSKSLDKKYFFVLHFCCKAAVCNCSSSLKKFLNFRKKNMTSN